MVVGDNFVFVHVPKTGGISITAALGGRSEKYSLHQPLFPLGWGTRKAFGFVRNPWDWVLSVYCYNVPDAAPSGFKSWLLYGELLLNDDYRSFKIAPMQRRSQMYWLNGCHRIGRFENLECDFSQICRDLGVPATKLQYLNGSKNRRLADYYDSETVEFVAKHCSDEIAKFGYRFEA